MKFINIKLLLITLLIVSLNAKTDRSHSKSHSGTYSKLKTRAKTLSKAHLKTNYWVRPLIKTAKSYHAFANLPYCPGDIINKLACPLCSSILDSSFEVFKYYKKKLDGYEFTFVILYSVNRNEAVISLSGPKSSSPGFYSTIYSRGFDNIGNPADNIKIEKTYLDIYIGKFQNKLAKYLTQYNNAFNVDPTNHKFVFVGHNIGGSLATLSCWDLISKGIIKANDEIDSPIVYSYGQLRIGNDDFVQKANAAFKIVRIVKPGDVYPRMPTCTWSPSINKFRCEEEFSYDDVEKSTRPELLNYIQNYYGKGGLHAGVEEPFRGNRMTFLEKSASSVEAKEERNSQAGWAYSASNPGYTVNTIGDPFDENGRTNDMGKITYSQPLGAEVMFSNNFKKHTICSYYYGIPNCEKGIAPEFDENSGNNYFNSDITDC